MTWTDLILALRDFTLRMNNGVLYVAPSERLTPELTAAIKEHRAGLVELIETEASGEVAIASGWNPFPLTEPPRLVDHV
jgi:hypothetical protein